MIKTDPELIDAAIKGDAQALEALLAECRPVLKKFARKTCNTAEDAEDAVQNALWILYKKIGTLKTIAAFATWLFRVVERECYRFFNRSKKYVKVDNLENNFDFIFNTSKDLQIDLTKAIAALPEEYREVLILRDIDELTAPETSDRLGIGTGAVKSRLHRARLMVRQHLEDGGYIA